MTRHQHAVRPVCVCIDVSGSNRSLGAQGSRMEHDASYVVPGSRSRGFHHDGVSRPNLPARRRARTPNKYKTEARTTTPMKSFSNWNTTTIKLVARGSTLSTAADSPHPVSLHLHFRGGILTRGSLSARAKTTNSAGMTSVQPYSRCLLFGACNPAQRDTGSHSALVMPVLRPSGRSTRIYLGPIRRTAAAEGA